MDGKTYDESIFKILGGVLFNVMMQDLFSILDIEHMIRSESDHTPTLTELSNTNEEYIKLFRFLNFWLKEESFMEVIGQKWRVDFEGNPFIVFHYKLKKIKITLSNEVRRTLEIYFRKLQYWRRSSE